MGRHSRYSGSNSARRRSRSPSALKYDSGASAQTCVKRIATGSRYPWQSAAAGGAHRFWRNCINSFASPVKARLVSAPRRFLSRIGIYPVPLPISSCVFGEVMPVTRTGRTIALVCGDSFAVRTSRRCHRFTKSSLFGAPIVQATRTSVCPLTAMMSMLPC